jgi:hypothetical protein
MASCESKLKQESKGRERAEVKGGFGAQKLPLGFIRS